MISIVCSTQTPQQKVKDHILKSCGISNAEFLFYKNVGEFSLTEVYQRGLKEAKFDTIIFVHDDVHFQTDNWGRKLKQLFEDSDYGVIGLAGTTDLGVDAKWWEQRNRMVGIVKHTNGQKTWENKYSGAFPKHIIQTVNVDGLFIAVDRNRIKYEFDTTIPGFHFYDIDFSFGNHVNGVKVGVTTDIRVIHRGLGETDQQWESNRLTFIDKFKTNLPAIIVPEPIINDIRYVENKQQPKVVIVIHGKNAKKITDCAVNIKTKTSYSNYRIIASYSDYDDIEIKADNVINEVIETAIDNFSTNANKIINEHIADDEKIVAFVSENSLIQNDVISSGVKYITKNKNCGTVTARVYNEDKTIFNAGYEVWNIIQQTKNPNDQQSSLLVNLAGNGSYYSYLNDLIMNTIGGTKDFMMAETQLFKDIKFNPEYKIAFQDLEFNLKSINAKRNNVVLGDGVVQLIETVNPGDEYSNDLNKVFLPFMYSQNLALIDRHIKKHIIPIKNV